MSLMFHRTITNLFRRSKIRSPVTEKLSTQNTHTLDRCSQHLESIFEQANLQDAVCDIQFMIAHAIGKKTLHRVPMNAKVTDSQYKSILHMAELRLSRMPVQYIIGEWDFRDITLDLKPPVFIPRPETEELVEYILNDPSIKSVRNYLEIGPGSGAISLSLLKSLPYLHGTAIDRSIDACKLTTHNARKLGVHERLTVLHGEIGQVVNNCVLKQNSSLFDMIVSNPPYIPTFNMNNLQPEISWYEDHGALDGGSDGLEVVTAILESAPHLVKPDSSIWLEVDTSHPNKIETMVSKLGCENINYKKTFTDFNSLPRFCQLVLRPS